jgi:hypothetical protein
VPVQELRPPEGVRRGHLRSLRPDD